MTLNQFKELLQKASIAEHMRIFATDDVFEIFKTNSGGLNYTEFAIALSALRPDNCFFLHPSEQQTFDTQFLFDLIDSNR